MHNEHAFRLSCGCVLADLDISVGVVHCAHGRTIFAPAFVDFVRERQTVRKHDAATDTENNLDHEVNELCDGVVAEILSKDLDAEDGVFEFALATVRSPLRS